MEIPIIFFSSSGNTKYVAQLIKNGLILEGYEPHLIQWDSLSSKLSEIHKYKVFGLGGPIYALSYPPFIISWIKDLPKAKNSEKFFLFDTSAGLPGNALTNARKMLEKKGYTFLGALEIISPTRDSLFESSYFKYIQWSRKKLDKSCQFGIKIGRLLKQTNWTPINWTIKKMPFANLIRKGFKFFEGFLFKIMGNSIEFLPSKCTSCKLCTRVCPTNAISFDEKPIIDPDLCNGCFNCLRQCPVRALYLKQFPDVNYFKGPQEIDGYIPPDELLDEYQNKIH